jgi:putative sigma-54 modulation protein
MNIAITFRHLDASEPVKDYASEKVAKLQKFLRQPMRARVTCSFENKLHRCEVEVNAGAAHFVATDSGEDMYASIDRVVDKLERQISHQHGVDVARKKGSESAREVAANATNGRGEGSERS